MKGTWQWRLSEGRSKVARGGRGSGLGGLKAEHCLLLSLAFSGLFFYIFPSPRRGSVVRRGTECTREYKLRKKRISLVLLAGRERGIEKDARAFGRVGTERDNRRKWERAGGKEYQERGDRETRRNKKLRESLRENKAKN